MQCATVQSDVAVELGALLLTLAAQIFIPYLKRVWDEKRSR